MLSNFEKKGKTLVKCQLIHILGLRRLSATLDEMEEKANDSQSEDEEDKMESYGEESEKVPTEDSKSNEADEDSIQLGEEGKEFTFLTFPACF